MKKIITFRGAENIQDWFVALSDSKPGKPAVATVMNGNLKDPHFAANTSEEAFTNLLNYLRTLPDNQGIEPEIHDATNQWEKN